LLQIFGFVAVVNRFINVFRISGLGAIRVISDEYKDDRHDGCEAEDQDVDSNVSADSADL